MSHAASAWAAEQTTGNPNRKAVLMFLADLADEAWSCYPGQLRIARVTELSERTVRAGLADLETGGFLRRERRQRTDGSRTSDRYWLNPPPAASAGDPDAEGGQPANEVGRNRQLSPKLPAAAAGHEPPVDPPVEPPALPLSSSTPSAPADSEPSTEVQQLCTALADAVERYRDGAQGGRPSITAKWSKDMRLLLERGPLGADQAVAIKPERVAACIAVVFRELAEPQGSTGFCWAKNVQSPGALRKHWWQIYAAARDQRQRSQLGRLGPVIRAGSGDVAPLGPLLEQHRQDMERRQLGAGAPAALGAGGS